MLSTMEIFLIDEFVTKETIRQFLREATIMENLKHANVLETIGVCVPQDTLPRVVLPLMSRGCLKELIRDESLVSEWVSGLSEHHMLFVNHH